MANDKQALSADHIVDAATGLIERDGLRAFTMRALGRELGVSAMAVYGYFPSREQLLAAVLERFMASMNTAPVPGERWDDTLRRTMTSLYELEMAHPQLASIEVTPEAGAEGLAVHTERIIAQYTAQGMPEPILAQLWAMVDAYLGGFIGNALFAKMGKEAAPAFSDAPNAVGPSDAADTSVPSAALGASAPSDAPAPSDAADAPLWQRIVASAYTDEAFAQGIEIIIKGVRALAAPDPCEWRTPE